MAASRTLSDSLTWSRYRSKKGQNRGQAVLLFIMKKPNLYEPSGYLDMPSIINSGFPFIFLPAARGTGKTFGTLRYFAIQEEKIMLLRRTQKEANLQAHSDSSSYKAYDGARVTRYVCKIPQLRAHYYLDQED